jgi:hypothetical protein
MAVAQGDSYYDPNDIFAEETVRFYKARNPVRCSVALLKILFSILLFIKYLTNTCVCQQLVPTIFLTGALGIGRILDPASNCDDVGYSPLALQCFLFPLSEMPDLHFSPGLVPLTE